MAVAREITKLYEECRAGTAAELAEYYAANPPKGEIVLLVAPPEEKETVDYQAELAVELQKGSLKTAVQKITEKYGLNKNEVYQAALELKNGR